MAYAVPMPIPMQTPWVGCDWSDAGEQGLPCDGMCKQGKPCTPSVISSTAEFLHFTFNSTPQVTDIDANSLFRQASSY